MKDTELKRMRDEALYRVYVEGSGGADITQLGDASVEASRHPAPQYFIDAKRISIYIGMIEARISLISLNSASRRRVWTLYDNYINWRRENPDSMLTRERVCEILVEQPAPEFYLQPDSARKIIQRKIKERKKEIMSR